MKISHISNLKVQYFIPLAIDDLIGYGLHFHMFHAHSVLLGFIARKHN